MASRGAIRTSRLLNAHVPSDGGAQNISQLYQQLKANVPFTEQERNMLNNALLQMYDRRTGNRKLETNGVPTFLLTCPEFRNKFIEHADKHTVAKRDIRGHLMAAAGSVHAQRREGLSDKGHSTQKDLENNGDDAITLHLAEYVRREMPNTMLVFHSAKHMADLTQPQHGFPHRSFRRNVVAHIGPPNSGKTHEAYRRLASAASGVYCAPLRMLAWEAHKRLNDDGVKCALLTGQEHRGTETDSHLACTVEMTPLEKNYQCAVIDEMQMVGDPCRGYAWTRAFLALQAPEIHLCGSNACYTLVKHLANIAGDTLQVTQHKPLGQVTLIDEPVSVEQLRPGDCVVCFSRNAALRLVGNIERTCFKNPGGKQSSTAVIYGSLPPETRAQQIEAFNDRRKHVLVASDVIGMGVNVRIKRIVFHRLTKFDGDRTRPLNAAEIQQIAGRAGRFALDCGRGYVGCMRAQDIGYLSRMIKQQQEQIERAVVAPDTQTVAAFADAIRSATEPQANLAQALQIYHSMAHADGAFEVFNLQPMLSVAKALANIQLPNSVLAEYLFVPLGAQPALTMVLRAFALSHAVLHNVKLRNVLNQEAADMLDAAVSDDMDQLDGMDGASVISRNPGTDMLRRMEMLYQILDAYVWLWHRFPDVYVDYHAVVRIKANVAKKIHEMLEQQLSATMPEEHLQQNSQHEEHVDAHITRQLIRNQ